MKSQSLVFSSHAEAPDARLCGDSALLLAILLARRDRVCRICHGEGALSLPALGWEQPAPPFGCPGRRSPSCQQTDLPVHRKGTQTPSGFMLQVSCGIHETAHTKMLTFPWALGLDLGFSQGKIPSDWERQGVRTR